MCAGELELWTLRFDASDARGRAAVEQHERRIGLDAVGQGLSSPLGGSRMSRRVLGRPAPRSGSTGSPVRRRIGPFELMVVVARWADVDQDRYRVEALAGQAGTGVPRGLVAASEPR
jgi:hypothetical protein